MRAKEIAQNLNVTANVVSCIGWIASFMLCFVKTGNSYYGLYAVWEPIVLLYAVCLAIATWINFLLLKGFAKIVECCSQFEPTDKFVPSNDTTWLQDVLSKYSVSNEDISSEDDIDD